MSSKFRKFVMLVMAAAISLSLVGCGNGGSSDDDRTVEVLYTGWNNIAMESDYDKNPYKKYIDETYDIDYKVSLTADLQNELAKRFSSSKTRKPDVILFTTEDYTSMKTLYNQGFFVSDYTPYLAQVPRFAEVFEESAAAKAKLTENGKIVALTLPGEEPVWMHKIRKDWVEQYAGGKIPETVDELLAMAAKVKAADDKQYLFTGAGENKNFNTLENFQFMFGDYNDWYVKDNAVSHPILDGSREKFLSFMRTIHQNGYIDPNWYTQNWTQKKINLNGGKVGIDWYPPAIATDYMFFNNDDEQNATGIWANMPMPTDTPGTARRGAAQSTFRNFIVISADAVKNEEKMGKILRLLNDMLYPTDGTAREDSLYMKIRWGLGIDNYMLGEGKEIEPILRDGVDTGFVTYYYTMNEKNHTRYNYGASWDYGVLMATTDDRVVEYLNAKQYGQSAFDYIDLFNDALEYYAGAQNYNYGEMLNLNATVQNNLDNLVNEYEITYVLGTNKLSYAEFVEQWRSYGGDTMKASAESQFRAAGLIR